MSVESVQGWSRDFHNISMEARDSCFWQYSVMASSRRRSEAASRYSRLWWWLSDASVYRECRIKCRAFVLMISCEFLCIKVGMGHPETKEWSGLWNSRWTVSFDLIYHICVTIHAHSTLIQHRDVSNYVRANRRRIIIRCDAIQFK